MTTRPIDDLFSIYDSLASISGSEDLYIARELSTRPNFRVAKDSDGNPALLITPELSNGPAAPPLELRYLSFRPRCVCRVRAENKSESVEMLAVIKCTATDARLREYFLRSLTGSVAALSNPPTEGESAELVSKLVELFRAMDSPARTSLQGIWCELFLISRASRVRQAAVAWHADPKALHDFMAGKQRVEVKSSMGPHRVHEFRLEQLLPLQDTRVVVASFMLDESGRGLSIDDLWAEISANPQMTVELRERVSQILTLSLGRDWRHARHVAFDPDAALAKLRLYDVALVPKLDSNIPAEVSDVRFKTELTDVSTLSRSEIIRLGGLFEAVFG
jgi:Putative  PD-(D/E)XK family member, (DUF4420)